LTNLEECDGTEDDKNMRVAELVEQITRKLQRGEPLEADDYLRQFPACSEPILALLPTLRDLSDLGRSISGARHGKRPTPGAKGDENQMAEHE
jgi:hypothetical protein